MITVKHNGDSTETWPGRARARAQGRPPLAQGGAARPVLRSWDDLTLAVGELAARALTVKYLTDEDGNTCYDYIQSTETTEG